MVRKIDNILAGCIEDIKAGKTSIKDCIKKYPFLAKKSRLLEIALKVKGPRVIASASFKARARAQLMEQVYSSNRLPQNGLGFLTGEDSTLYTRIWAGSGQ
jgi:hypothetical protein